MYTVKFPLNCLKPAHQEILVCVSTIVTQVAMLCYAGMMILGSALCAACVAEIDGNEGVGVAVFMIAGIINTVIFIRNYGCGAEKLIGIVIKQKPSSIPLAWIAMTTHLITTSLASFWCVENGSPWAIVVLFGNIYASGYVFALFDSLLPWGWKSPETSPLRG